MWLHSVIKMLRSMKGKVLTFLILCEKC